MARRVGSSTYYYLVCWHFISHQHIFWDDPGRLRFPKNRATSRRRWWRYPFCLGIWCIWSSFSFLETVFRHSICYPLSGRSNISCQYMHLSWQSVFLKPSFHNLVAQHGTELIDENRGNPLNRGIDFKASQYDGPFSWWYQESCSWHKRFSPLIRTNPVTG